MISSFCDKNLYTDWKLACQMNPSPASEVPPDKLPEIVSRGLLPEPIHEPSGLMSHQDHLILRPHPLLSYPGKIPVTRPRP